MVKRVIRDRAVNRWLCNLYDRPRPVVQIEASLAEQHEKNDGLHSRQPDREPRRNHESKKRREGELCDVLQNEMTPDIGRPVPPIHPQTSVDPAMMNAVGPRHGTNEGPATREHTVQNPVDDVEEHGRRQKQEHDRGNPDQ